MTDNVFRDDQKAYFSEELKETFDFIENTLSYEHPSLTISENFFLLAVFERRECLAYKILEALLSTSAFNIIHDAYYELVKKSQLIAVKPGRKILFSPAYERMIDNGIEEMKNLGDEKLSTIHIILAMLNPDKLYTSIRKVLNPGGLNYHLLMGRLLSLKSDNNREENNSPNINNGQPQIMTSKLIVTPQEFEKMVASGAFNGGIKANKANISGQYINNFCHNLNKRAKEGKIDPVIGRMKEINRIGQVFNRRKKNNVVIVGDKGSGKTTIAEGLALMIQNGTAPHSLLDKTLLKLDVSAMIAGTTFRGMFEERAKGVFSELQKNPNCVLVIDDYHNHIGKKDGEAATDITPFMKEAINDGNINILMTCSPKGYHKKFDSDASLASKFQRIDLVPLSDEEIREILHKVKNIYEEYHEIELTDDIIDLCITLCKKYVTDREMPDSVIDLIDEIGACVSNKYAETDEIRELKEELAALSKSKENAISEGSFDEVDEINEKEQKKLADIKKKDKKKPQKVMVTNEMVFSVISDKTGIPIQNLSDEGKKDLGEINNKIKETVIGQDEAVDAVCKAIKRRKLGLHNGRGTAYFLLGPTGCGKTLLAKKLAELLFGSESAMVRFDMSEYADKTAVNKLIGSSAGYVGYEEGGLLTEAIKNKKHCILLLDEIEKADDEIFNIFLQVFDEGFLTDNTGQKVDFRNTIILLTSNTGAKKAQEMGKSIGFRSAVGKEEDRTNDILDKELKKRFAPEFLNRLDGIIYFNHLTEENMKDIISLELKKSANRFKDIGYNLTYDESVVEHISEMIKGESEYGARPILRAIQNEVEDPVTDAILDGLCDNNVKITYEEDSPVIECGEIEKT